MSLRKIFFAFSYLAFLAGVLLAANFAVYRVRKIGDTCIAELKEYIASAAEAEPLKQKMLFWVGTTLTAPVMSPERSIPKRPAEGTVRIGIFGDSYTAGTEVLPHLSMPALLQQLFHDQGMRHVEVLNFGRGGFGIHQSYLAWELLGRDYHLNLVIFGPHGYFPEDRDRSFLNGSKNALHARFILTPTGDLELLSLAGDSVEDAAQIYASFWPRWRYLRYDLRSPFFLKALLPPGMTMSNPWYYKKNALREEHQEIYHRLFRKWAQSTPHLIVLQIFPELLQTLAAGKPENLHLLHADIPLDRPYYWAPNGHLGGTGNLHLARLLFAYLTGNNSEVSFLDPTSAAPDADEPSPQENWNSQVHFRGPLSPAKPISLIVEGKPIAELSPCYPDNAVNMRKSEEIFSLSPEKGLTMIMLSQRGDKFSPLWERKFCPILAELSPNSTLDLACDGKISSDHRQIQLEFPIKNAPIAIADLSAPWLHQLISENKCRSIELRYQSQGIAAIEKEKTSGGPIIIPSTCDACMRFAATPASLISPPPQGQRHKVYLKYRRRGVEHHVLMGWLHAGTPIPLPAAPAEVRQILSQP